MSRKSDALSSIDKTLIGWSGILFLRARHGCRAKPELEDGLHIDGFVKFYGLIVGWLIGFITVS
jgi:hypothetical protein